MPARLVIALEDPTFAVRVAQLLIAGGHDCIALPDSMAALNALGNTIEVLVTSVEQSPGKPNGVSLALMARMKRPAVRVIFVGPAEVAPLVSDVGMLLPSPVSAENVAAVAIGMVTRRGY
jgi:hypothetical protein